MKIVRLRKFNDKVLRGIAHELCAGAVIVYPTDTAYGLGCDATNARAVADIFRVKGRAASKGLPIIAGNLKMAEKFFRMGEAERKMARRYWPGPLSLVLPAKKGIAKAALEKGTAAVRVPASEIARELALLCGRPLAATSANLSGLPACYSIKAFLAQVNRSSPRPLSLPSPRLGRGGGTISSPVRGRGGRSPGEGGQSPDLVLDAGALRRRKPSTIVRMLPGGRMEVLRKGPIRL